MASNFMAQPKLVKTQRGFLKLVTEKYPQVYLVGGTAINLLCGHRVSEDLDFFTQEYSSKLHLGIAAYIRRSAGFHFTLIEEEKRKKYLPMAVYEFEVGKNFVLKVDFVKDFMALIQPRRKNGMASIEDIYYRKILTVIGWKADRSRIDAALAGGRQKAKDLFDIFYLSAHIKSLSEWFPKCFDQASYERLTAWYLGIPKQKTVMELLDVVPGCDTKAVFKHLDEEIIHKLNRKYLGL